MKIIKSIKQWWLALKEARKAKLAEKEKVRLYKLSCTVINVMEFDGEMYISHDGVPIVNVNKLNIKIPELLQESRANYLVWKSKLQN